MRERKQEHERQARFIKGQKKDQYEGREDTVKKLRRKKNMNKMRKNDT